MNKTLAQLKKDIEVSTYIEYIKREERPNDYINNEYIPTGEFIQLPIPEKIQGRRYVSYKDTTGFYLKQPTDKSMRGSHCQWPKASQLTYTDDTFIITETTKAGHPYQRRTYKIITL